MGSTKQPDDTWTTFAMSVFRLNGLLMEVGENIVRPIGQSSARWQVLGRAFEPRTVAQIARDVGYARQSVQRVADVLVGEGLVAYKVHPTDRRTRLLELTPEGLGVLTAIYTRQLAWSQHIMNKLNPDQLIMVAKALEEVGKILEFDLKENGDPEGATTTMQKGDK